MVRKRVSLYVPSINHQASRLWVPFQPITAPYFPLLIKPRDFAKRQCKRQWLTPPILRHIGIDVSFYAVHERCFWVKPFPESSELFMCAGTQLFLSDSQAKRPPTPSRDAAAQHARSIFGTFRVSGNIDRGRAKDVSRRFSVLFGRLTE